MEPLEYPTLADGSPGRRVAPRWDRLSVTVTANLAKVPTAVIGDAMNRLGVMSGRLGRISGGSFIGPAITVWVRSGDNFMIHRALELAEPGDVLVVNGQGSLAHGLFGEVMARKAIARGVVGLVVDGAVRDSHALKALGLPTHACGICAAGPAKEGTGEVGYPVACGGVSVTAGDLIVGDEDGVVVVPKADVAVVSRNVSAVLAWEAQQRHLA